MATQKTHTVTIESDGTLCTVTPKVLTVDCGDNVAFRNETVEPISILIAEEEMFRKYNFAVDPNEEESMPVESVEGGESLYAVFCWEIKGFAQASSMPKIIVRPK